MEKYIVELKESLLRKLLRYCLWAILTIGLIALAAQGVRLVVQTIVQANMKATAGLLVEMAPQRAIILAESIYRTEPTPKTRLALLKVLIEAHEWMLADALLDSVRPCSDFKTTCYDLLVTSNVAPESLPALVETFKINPQSDDERILLAKVAGAVSDVNLRNLARRSLRQMESDFFRDKAMLWMAMIAKTSGDTAQAREIAIQLLSRPLLPSEAVDLLGICEELKLAEADDYRSTLKINARGSLPMALALARYFEKATSTQKVADWLNTLPVEILNHPEAKLRLVELLYRAGKLGEAVSVVEKIGDSTLRSALESLLKENPIDMSSLTEDDLITLARLSEAISHYPQEQQALAALNQKAPSLWSLSAAVVAATKAKDAVALPVACETLAMAADNSMIVRANAAYWQLVSAVSDEKTQEAATPKTIFKSAFETLKAAHAKYPGRFGFSVIFALANYRLGNLTDALLLLPAEPVTDRELLISLVVLAHAGQSEKAMAISQKILPEALSAPERELYNQAMEKLKTPAPLQQLFDLLKPDAIP